MTPIARIEAVELGEQLVERLLLLVVRRRTRRAPRLRPSASSSSMKMMQGAAFRACSNRSRTRAAPTPTNISTNSEPEIEKNGTPASPATARASSVLPVPGGPTSRMPFGMRAPSRPIGFRIPQEGDDLLQLELGLVDAGDVREGHLGVGLDIDLGARLADRHQAAEPLASGDAAKQHGPDQVEDEGRQHPGQRIVEQVRRRRAGDDDVVGGKLVGELGSTRTV